MEYYDENFGHWHSMDDEDMQEFYRQVQEESVWKECNRCGRQVKLRPDYNICNSCAEKIEQGLDP